MNCLRYWARYMRKGEVKSGSVKNTKKKKKKKNREVLGNEWCSFWWSFGLEQRVPCLSPNSVV